MEIDIYSINYSFLFVFQTGLLTAYGLKALYFGRLVARVTKYVIHHSLNFLNYTF